MSKAKPAKPTVAALLQKCEKKRPGLVVSHLPKEQFDALVELFTAYRDNPGKYSLRAIEAVFNDAFGTNLGKSSVGAAYQEFTLGKLKKAT